MIVVMTMVVIMSRCMRWVLNFAMDGEHCDEKKENLSHY